MKLDAESSDNILTQGLKEVRLQHLLLIKVL